MKILDRVKRDITREMESQQTHTGSSWADIMLRHSSKLQKTEDQKEFWKWLLDPNEEQDIEMTFAEIDPQKIVFEGIARFGCSWGAQSPGLSPPKSVKIAHNSPFLHADSG